METMTTAFTRVDYDRLPEGFPAQLIEGCLVKDATPVSGHQTLITALIGVLRPLVGTRRVVASPVDVPIDEINVFQPDVAVYRDPLPPHERWAEVPLLAFEVLSPSSARRDRGWKARRYLEAGVEEVWIVDPDARTIEVRSKAQQRQASGREALASEALPGFHLVPDALFTEALG